MVLLFHCFDICTEGAKAVVGKSASVHEWGLVTDGAPGPKKPTTTQFQLSMS